MTPINDSSSVFYVTRPGKLSERAARELLSREDCQAFSAAAAAVILFGDDLFDDAGQPADDAELEMMAEGESLMIPEETRVRVCGLFHTLCGDQFTNTPVHFERLTGAIIHGDPFIYEDDGETPDLTDALWAIHQAGLMLDDEDILDELSPAVLRRLEAIGDDEAEDLEEAAAALVDSPGDATESRGYVYDTLRLRLTLLAGELVSLGFEASDMADTSKELADLMAAASA
jgi:hypothetical protein